MACRGLVVAHGEGVQASTNGLRQGQACEGSLATTILPTISPKRSFLEGWVTMRGHPLALRPLTRGGLLG